MSSSQSPERGCGGLPIGHDIGQKTLATACIFCPQFGSRRINAHRARGDDFGSDSCCCAGGPQQLKSACPAVADALFVGGCPALRDRFPGEVNDMRDPFQRPPVELPVGGRPTKGLHGDPRNFPDPLGLSGQNVDAP